MEPHKIGTARVVVWKEYQVTNSFTLETSFHGYSHGGERTIEFTRDYFEQIGCVLGKGFTEYYQLSKQIERDTMLTQGWLKPKMLFEMTGVPAEELL